MRVILGNPECTSDQAEDAVSIAELKNLARKLLPSSSALKRLVLSQPDLLSADEIEGKLIDQTN